MKCPNEFILSQYADGELSKNEFMELESHLAACGACPARVAELRAENRLLTQSLHSIDSCEPAAEAAERKQPEFSGIDRLAAAAIVFALLLRVGLSFIEESEFPSVLQWLHPWSLSGFLNWLMNGLFYLIEEGRPLMTTLIETAGFVFLGLLLLGCTLAIARRAIRTRAILGLISLLFAFVIPSHAIEVRKAEKGMGSDITIAANETVDDTLMVFADSVNISGTITGDLIAFARSVDIQGTVQGNVISFAQRIDIPGNVNGDVLAFAQSLRMDGQFARSFWGFGQTVTIGKSIRLKEDAAMFASNAYINGDLGRDAMVYAGTLDVRGRIARDLLFRGGWLMVHNPSVIGRNLDSRTPSVKEIKIDSGVLVQGKRIVQFEAAKPSRYRTLSFYTGQAFRICALFLLGLLLYWVAPRLRTITFSNIKATITSGGIGFLSAVAAPIAAILLAITLIGIPVALILLALWLLGLFLAKIVVAKWLGTVILGSRENGLSSSLLPLFVGLLLVLIAVNLPYIGGVINFLLILIGLGALVIDLYRSRQADVSLGL
jgi:cytoskeletal protein CcmA (bactofilin family)